MSSLTASQDISAADYKRILDMYLRSHSEDALYEASLMSQSCIESGLGPEDIVALHFDALSDLMNNRSHVEQVRVAGDAQQFLLETMIAYGVKFKEYLELKLSETMRDAQSQAARDRERVDEAERLQREKDEILAAIAHELRTPIMSVQGNLELVTRSLNRGNIAPLETYIGRAREGIDRLSRLSADLVEASRGGLPPLSRTRIDLCVIVDQATDWARPAAAAKGVELRVVTHPVPLSVRGDADGLLTVLGNLLSNAIRYTAGGGMVSVTADRRGSEVSVAVRDTGIGMSPDTQERIFNKFFRAAEARVAEAKGLGLGLSLVQQLVKAHGGHVGVESVEGEGSTFTVFLPLVND